MVLMLLDFNEAHTAHIILDLMLALIVSNSKLAIIVSNSIHTYLFKRCKNTVIFLAVCTLLWIQTNIMRQSVHGYRFDIVT